VSCRNETPPDHHSQWIAAIAAASAVLINLVLRAVNRIVPDPHADIT
jgi:hypothetical protein